MNEQQATGSADDCALNANHKTMDNTQPQYPLPPLANLTYLAPHLIPYAIIAINFILFKLLRSFVNKISTYYLIEQQQLRQQQQQRQRQTSRSNNKDGKFKLVKLFIDELISTCELCADCAELNVVYEKHGSFAYGFSLSLLTYLWIDAFGEAHTTPGYLIEDYILIKGNQMFKTGDMYARFIGQSIAMPLAWRIASIYWKYQLLVEHKEMLNLENCKSSLSTSTINGFLIELSCCLLCRLAELYGHKLLERRCFSQRFVSMMVALFGTILVVTALELSGGYFNPVLASSLEYGCRGTDFYQHVLVFWLGPLLGHVLARGLYKRLNSSDNQVKQPETTRRDSLRQTVARNEASKRLTRSNSLKKKA